MNLNKDLARNPAYIAGAFSTLGSLGGSLFGHTFPGLAIIGGLLVTATASTKYERSAMVQTRKDLAIISSVWGFGCGTVWGFTARSFLQTTRPRTAALAFVFPLAWTYFSYDSLSSLPLYR
eukprot:TRINITY_DN17256_c0_g1_i1.p1 TRINITY_DN17256_c0_g1~~TRINITY_DN17256_c0_g1_i1.p1  ORF type:complete len:121 (+),score=7.81 TRINITY_DN17256_c0_g1_i1:31-393(+)